MIPVRTPARSLLAALFSLSVALGQECSYEGGWALRAPGSCPPNAPVECGTGAQPRCCPSGYTCTGDGDYVGNYCCKDPEDCRSLALEYPQCPDSSWKLWGVNGKLDNGGWCCMDGFNGTYRDNSQGIALLCTSTTATALPVNISWADAVSTSSCSVTATSTLATTATGSSVVSDTATTIGTATASSTGTASAGNEESGGISGGAVAGAVVGGVAGIGLILAAIFFVWRRKRGSRAAVTGPDGSDQGGWAYGEQIAGKHAYQMPSEMSAQPSRVEMDGSPLPTYELDGSTPHELDSAAMSATRPR